MDTPFKFSKLERLKQRRLFDALFSGANRSIAHPVMVLWKQIPLPSQTSIQVGFSVPKKHFKKASERNTIKRRLREIYRLENKSLKHKLAEGRTQIAVLFIVLKTDNTSYEGLQKKMMVLLREIEQKVVHVP